MKSIYVDYPAAVAIYINDMGTDVVMTKDVHEIVDEQTSQKLYECEEVQARLAYPLTEAEVKDDFDGWWEIIANAKPQRKLTPEERLAKLRSDIDYLAAVLGVDLEE